MGISDYLSLNADIKLKQKNKQNNLVDEINPVKNGIITFLSFIVFGFIPIVLFFIFSSSKKNKYIKLIISVTISLFLLGSVQSKYTKEPWYFTGTRLSVFGIITASIAFLISKKIMELIKNK